MRRQEPLTATDYLTALRRSAWLLVLGAVLGAVVFGGLGAVTRNDAYEQSMVVRRTEVAELASSLGLPTNLPPEWVASSELERRKAAVEVAVPGALDDGTLVMVANDKASTVRFTAQGSTKEEAIARATTAAKAFVTAVRTDATAAIAAVRDAAAANLDRLQTQLSSTTDTVERALLLTQFDVAARVRLGAEQLAAQNGGVSDPEPLGLAERAPASAPATYAIVGALAGAVLAAVIVVLRRITDTRIRSADDVAHDTTARVLGTTTQAAPTGPDETLLSIAVQIVGRDTPPRRVALTSVTGAVAPTLAARLADALRVLGHAASVRSIDNGARPDDTDGAANGTIDVLAVTRPLDTSSDGLLVASYADVTVPVVTAGRTTIAQLVNALEAIDRVGTEVPGVILVSD